MRRNSDRQAELYVEVLAGLNLPALLIDPAGRILGASPSAESMLGFEPGALQDVLMDSLLSPRNPEWIGREVRKEAMMRGWTGDLVLTSKEGREYWTHVQACAAPSTFFPQDATLMSIEDCSGHAEFTSVMMQRAEELYDRNRQLEVVSKIGRLMLDSSDLDSKLSSTLKETAEAIGADMGCFFIGNRHSDELVCRSVYGIDPDPMVGKVSIDRQSNSLTALSLRGGRVLMAEDVTTDPFVMKELVGRYDVKSMLSVPLIANNEPFGAMGLANTDHHRTYSQEELTLVEIVAGYVASAIYTSVLSEDMRLFREHAEQAAKWASLGELHAGIAHSFGNIMTSIQCTLDLLLHQVENARETALAEKIRHALQVAKDGSGLVRQLLMFSKSRDVKTGRASLEMAAKVAVEMCRAHPSARERSIAILIPPDMPRVEGHPGPLQDIIFTLVLNSLQATSPGGEVRIEAGMLEDGSPELRVIDNGSGMTPEVLCRAFEPFFTTKGSTGLGLSTTAGLVHYLGGSIAAESEVGKGTTIRVRLNAAREMDAAA